MIINPKFIRNFSLIAHIDHGKTSISSRIIEMSSFFNRKSNKFGYDVLDSMDLEKERGITIKSRPVSTFFRKWGNIFLLNLIDTPGHTDFSNEVSRSLLACEGVLLIIDATKGIESQTLINIQLALKKKLVIIPIINKIDLPNSRTEEISSKIKNLLSISSKKKILKVSAKFKIGINQIIDSIIKEIPYPICNQKDYKKNYTRIIVFGFSINQYKGIICFVRIISGDISKGEKIIFLKTRLKAIVKEVGIFTFEMNPQKVLKIGYTGYIIFSPVSCKNKSLKNFDDILSKIKIGDIITKCSNPIIDKVHFPLYLENDENNSTLFSSLYTENSSDFEKLKTGLEYLSMNDSSLKFKTEYSKFFGFGFRCKFLGLLHMDIVKERILRKYKIRVISTYPNINFLAVKKDGSIIKINKPSKLENTFLGIKKIREPIMRGFILSPKKYIGRILSLIFEKRGFYKDIVFLKEKISNNYIKLKCYIPLNEMLFDFNDRIKSISNGFASIKGFSFSSYRDSDLVKLDVLINGSIIDPLSVILHRSKTKKFGENIIEYLTKSISKKLFLLRIQIRVNKRIILKKNIKSLRKNVTSKCYGGDISRKRKLLEKQKFGKKKMQIDQKKRGMTISKEILSNFFDKSLI
jgi:GTP-binding protein LepA